MTALKPFPLSDITDTFQTLSLIWNRQQRGNGESNGSKMSQKISSRISILKDNNIQLKNWDDYRHYIFHKWTSGYTLLDRFRKTLKHVQYFDVLVGYFSGIFSLFVVNPGVLADDFSDSIVIESTFKWLTWYVNKYVAIELLW